jgi:predicted transcriptional regulator
VGLAWGLAAGAGAVGLAAALARAARRGWPWLAALYTRLASAEVLEHPQREALAALVREEPGVSFREAQRRLGLASGALTHHARVLERAGVLFSTPDGQHRRFFLTSHGRVDAVPPLGERALASLDAPATLAEVARRLGASRGALRYHVRRLEEQGRLRAQRQGRDVVLSRAEAAARPRPRRARSQEQAARGSPDLPAARQNPSIHVISLRAATSVQDLPCTPETSPGSSQAS